MKIKWNNKYVHWGLTALLVICGAILFYYLVFHTTNIKLAVNMLLRVLAPVYWGFILAYLLTPVLNFIEYRFLYPLIEKISKKKIAKPSGIVRALSIILTVLLFCLLLYALISMFLSQIIPSVQSIITNFDTYVNNMTKWINTLLDDNPDIKDYVVTMLDRYSNEMESFLNGTVLPKSSELLKTVSLSVIAFLKFLWNFIIGIIISIYLLASKESFASQVKKITYALWEKDSANLIINNVRFAHNTFIGFISGKVLDSIIMGLLCFIGTTLLQTPYATLVSVIVGVTNVIPFIGPLLGMIPSAVLVFVVDPAHPLNCVYFLIFVIVLQQIDGNIIGPKILGDSTGLSGFWVIFAITLFGGLWGLFGMIVGVPLFAVIYAAIKSFVNTSLMKKRMPTVTDSYAHVECIDEQGMHIYEGSIRKNAKAAQKRKKGSDKPSDASVERYHSGMNFICSNDEWVYRYKGDGPLAKETLQTVEETDEETEKEAAD